MKKYNFIMLCGIISIATFTWVSVYITFYKQMDFNLKVVFNAFIAIVILLIVDTIIKEFKDHNNTLV